MSLVKGVWAAVAGDNDRAVSDRYCTIYYQIAYADTIMRLFAVFAISYILLKIGRPFAVGRGGFSTEQFSYRRSFFTERLNHRTNWTHKDRVEISSACSLVRFANEHSFCYA